MDDLLARWVSFWSRVGARGDIEGEGRSLLARYDEPWRAHHSRGHLREFYDLFDTYRHLAHEPDALEAAIPLHDSVYVIGSKTNEEDSATLGDGIIERLGVPRLIAPARGLTLATKHVDFSDDSDTRLFCDLDCAILGMPRPRYLEYMAGIEAEYRTLYTVPQYLVGRILFVDGFLRRGRFFATPQLYERFNQVAKENLEWELNYLRERKLQTDLAKPL